jgi:ADP-ribose pyrophosphatase YjhB (NUDIX family)
MIVTLDFICLRMNHETGLPEVMLQERKKAPEAGRFALVGGWVWEKPAKGSDLCDRTLDDAVKRIMQNKVGFMPSYLEQFKAEGSLTRDPSLGWSVTIPHLCLFNRPDNEVLYRQAGFHWEPLQNLLDGSYPLPFDHQTLVRNAHEVFVNKIRYSSLLLYLLPEKVAIKEIVDAYALFGIRVTKQTIISRWISEGLLVDTGEKRKVTLKGPASVLYRLKEPSLSYFDSEIGKRYATRTGS